VNLKHIPASVWIIIAILLAVVVLVLVSVFNYATKAK
jgi:hypothetical protein